MGDARFSPPAKPAPPSSAARRAEMMKERPPEVSGPPIYQQTFIYTCADLAAVALSKHETPSRSSPCSRRITTTALRRRDRRPDNRRHGQVLKQRLLSGDVVNCLPCPADLGSSLRMASQVSTVPCRLFKHSRIAAMPFACQRRTALASAPSRVPSRRQVKRCRPVSGLTRARAPTIRRST